jgi:hypothetical protein
MKRESLINIRTVREIVSSLDRARLQPRVKTTNLLARGGKETQPTINPVKIAPALLKERLRFQKRIESLNRSQMKILGARQKLANTKEKNRHIMELRLKLYKQHWDETSPVRTHQPSGNGKRGLHDEPGASIGSKGLAPKGKHRTLRYGGRRDA